jgi:hypothetical protein
MTRKYLPPLTPKPLGITYIESASFKFKFSLLQSARFRFLAEIAVSLENAEVPDRNITNLGFSLELYKNGNVEVVVWDS